MIANEDEARAWVAALPNIAEGAIAKLDQFMAMLKGENERQNLVARNSLPHVWQRHIADSAQLLLHVPRETTTWLDLGTGSGFPGIVIAALRPDLRVTMVESRSRRVEWLDRVSTALALHQSTVLGSRLEVVAARPFEVISARAFAPLGELLSLSARFSTEHTCWLLPKGRSATQELERLHGWRHRFHVVPSQTDPEAGIVVGRLLGPKGTQS